MSEQRLRQSVTVLGSTGSIGTQTLEVMSAHPDRFALRGLAVGSDAEGVVAQALRFGASQVAVADPAAAARARVALDGQAVVLDGPGGVAELAAGGQAGPADIVVNGMVGSRGLQPTLAALDAGSRVALANKESLIVGGALVTEAARNDGSAVDGLPLGDRLLPVDSEHSALAQCLRGSAGREVSRLLVTASGGPFRGYRRADLAAVTVEDALAHPTWSMGAVITVNSATLANKGLEVIEAHLLFDVGYDAIDVVVHPQSIVHGLVEFCDGAVVAELSPPDMRLPIQLALAWPERLDVAPARLDWTKGLALEFEPADAETFRMLDLCITAGRRAGTAPAVTNAANEVAVEAFLRGHLPFLGIAGLVEAVLEEHSVTSDPDLATVLAAEQWARVRAGEQLQRRATTRR